MKCTNDFFLDGKLCKARTQNSKFEDCEERDPFADKCQKCKAGKALTGDKFMCLDETANCIKYEDSTKNSSSLTCEKCADGMVYSKT